MTTTYPMLTVGQRVLFAREKRPMKVRAVSDDGRFVILTKPFNLRRTVLYSVIDQERGVRGRDNFYGLGYEDDEQIADAMARFVEGTAEVSYRHWVWLSFDDDQPDPAVAALLPALREQAAYTPNERQNAVTKFPKPTLHRSTS